MFISRESHWPVIITGTHGTLVDLEQVDDKVFAESVATGKDLWTKVTGKWGRTYSEMVVRVVLRALALRLKDHQTGLAGGLSSGRDVIMDVTEEVAASEVVPATAHEPALALERMCLVHVQTEFSEGAKLLVSELAINDREEPTDEVVHFQGPLIVFEFVLLHLSAVLLFLLFKDYATNDTALVPRNLGQAWGWGTFDSFYLFLWWVFLFWFRFRLRFLY